MAYYIGGLQVLCQRQKKYRLRVDVGVKNVVIPIAHTEIAGICVLFANLMVGTVVCFLLLLWDSHFNGAPVGLCLKKLRFGGAMSGWRLILMSSGAPAERRVAGSPAGSRRYCYAGQYALLACLLLSRCVEQLACRLGFCGA